MSDYKILFLVIASIAIVAILLLEIIKGNKKILSIKYSGLFSSNYD